jgi:hypothetical protein
MKSSDLVLEGCLNLFLIYCIWNRMNFALSLCLVMIESALSCMKVGFKLLKIINCVNLLSLTW